MRIQNSLAAEALAKEAGVRIQKIENLERLKQQRYMPLATFSQQPLV